MQLTKFGHSCVRVADGDRALVFDPGAFSAVAEALDGAQAIVVTHEHADHVDADAITAALRADPRLQLVAPNSVAAQFAGEFGEQVVTVGPGEALEIAGFAATTFGGQHAVIHPQIPVITNVGYVLDGVVAHPGDSFAVPPGPVDTLLLPVMAPWSKVSEVIDYAVAVRAPHALPIHDALVTELYAPVLQRNFDAVAGALGVSLGSFADPVTVG